MVENCGRRKFYPFCHFVNFNVEEVQVLIEVLVFEQAFTDHLREEEHHVASLMLGRETQLASSWKYQQ